MQIKKGLQSQHQLYYKNLLKIRFPFEKLLKEKYLFTEYCISMQLLPTPEFPIKSNLKR